MGQFLKNFEPSLFPWTHLEPPKITGELVDKMHSGCERLAGDAPIDELERVRDDALIGILEALQQRNLGAGAVLNQHQKRIHESADSDRH